jgi:hypothetical protein
MRPSGSRANLDCQAHRRTEPSQHIDKRVRTEQVDPPTEKIANTGLGYIEYLGCISLFEAARRDELLNLDHQIRSDQQMLGLFVPKPNVTEYIPCGRRDLQFQSIPPLSRSHCSALCNQCLIPLFGKFYIVLRCFSGSFFEGMEHIDRFLKLGNIADTMFHRSVNSDLPDSRPNTRHRFPVRRLHSLLNQPKLKTRKPPGIRRECLKVMSR